MPRVSRRKFIAISGVGTVGVAGCIGSDDDNGDDTAGDDDGSDADADRPDEHEEILDYWEDQAQEESGTFRFYTAMPTEPAHEMMDQFVDRFNIDGDDAEVFRGVTGDAYSRFQEELAAGASTADIIMLGDHGLHLDMRDDDQLLAYDANQNQYYPDDLTSEYWGTPRVLTYAMAWNTDEVDESDIPEDWADTLNMDPDVWGNNFTIGNPHGGGAYQFYHAMDNEFGDEYWEWVEHWIDLGAVAHQPHGTMQEEMMSGQHPLTMAQIHYRVNELLEQDPNTPVDWHVPEGEYGGTPVGTTAMSITSQTERPATAKLFVEWALSEEGVEIIQRGDYGYTPRDPAPVEWTHVPATYHDLEHLPIDFQRGRDERERIQQQFDELYDA